jgi:hypothetical protein
VASAKDTEMRFMSSVSMYMRMDRIKDG